MTGDQTVLVVDDESDIVELATDLLREQGYRFLSAANADIALIILQQPSITFDLLITDVIMPGALDGVGLAVEACRIIPHLRVIYMTGYGGIADARFREAPPGTILPKPWGVKQFVQAVDAALVTTADLS